MKKVTCICDTTISGVKFIKGCNYEVDYNPFIGIMIYAPHSTTQISANGSSIIILFKIIVYGNIRIENL